MPLGAGSTSARVDITAGSTAYAGISLRQAGLSLEAGRQYVLTVSTRAAAPRDVRVRVASASGAQYFGRIVSVTPQWASQTFTFTASVGAAAPHRRRTPIGRGLWVLGSIARWTRTGR